MAKVESFDGLISSIQDAFLSVNRMAEQQHLESIKEFFDEEGNPKTIAVKYPSFTEVGTVDYTDVEIPQICLVPISSLKLNEITVDFKVKLSAEINLQDGSKRNDIENFQLSESTEKKKKKMGFIPEYRQKPDDGYANITLKFSAEEPPEGIMRIRDEMIKILP